MNMTTDACAMYFFILRFFHVRFDILIPLVNNKVGIKATQKNVLVIMTFFLEIGAGGRNFSFRYRWLTSENP